MHFLPVHVQYKFGLYKYDDEPQQTTANSDGFAEQESLSRVRSGESVSQLARMKAAAARGRVLAVRMMDILKTS